MACIINYIHVLTSASSACIICQLVSRSAHHLLLVSMHSSPMNCDHAHRQTDRQTDWPTDQAISQTASTDNDLPAQRLGTAALIISRIPVRSALLQYLLVNHSQLQTVAILPAAIYSNSEHQQNHSAEIQRHQMSSAHYT